MKKILGYTMFFLFMSTGMQAQDFDLDDIIGEAQDFFDGAQKEAEKTADTEAQRKFKETFNDKFKNYNKYISNLDNYSPYSKCFYLMIKYIMELEELKVATEVVDDCKKTYDLYGMQLIAMMSSTNIMFCTEELYNDLQHLKEIDKNSDPQMGRKEKIQASSDDIKRFFGEMNDFAPLVLVAGYTNDKKQDLLRPIGLEYTDFEDTLIRFFLKHTTFMIDHNMEFEPMLVAGLIEKYFHPLSLMTDGVAISQQMDRLKPCTGY